MIVRVFIPKKLDPSDGSDFDGHDYNFEVLPAVGNTLRLADPSSPDFEVERVGFIQDGEAFVASVWMKRDHDISDWIKGMVG